jgi:hypothetical protein
MSARMYCCVLRTHRLASRPDLVCSQFDRYSSTGSPLPTSVRSLFLYRFTAANIISITLSVLAHCCQLRIPSTEVSPVIFTTRSTPFSALCISRLHLVPPPALSVGGASSKPLLNHPQHPPRLQVVSKCPQY